MGRSLDTRESKIPATSALPAVPFAELEIPSCIQANKAETTPQTLFDLRLAILTFHQGLLLCPSAPDSIFTLLSRFQRLGEANPWKNFSHSAKGAAQLIQSELQALEQKHALVIKRFQKESEIPEQETNDLKFNDPVCQTSIPQQHIKPRHYQKLAGLLGGEALDLIQAIEKQKANATTRVSEIYKSQLNGIIEQAKPASPGLELKEIEQLLYLSLVACIQAFEPERGTPFISFLQSAFKRDLTRAIQSNRQLIRIPHKTRSQFFSLYHGARQEHQVENPSAEQLASFAGISLRRAAHIERLVERMQITQQFSRAGGSRSDYNPADIPDPSEDTNALVRVQRREAYINLQLAFTALRGTHPKISYILERHFGLYAKKPCSLKELALEFAVSIARIHELEKQGLKLLRSNRHIKNLGDD